MIWGFPHFRKPPYNIHQFFGQSYPPMFCCLCSAYRSLVPGAKRGPGSSYRSVGRQGRGASMATGILDVAASIASPHVKTAHLFEKYRDIIEFTNPMNTICFMAIIDQSCWSYTPNRLSFRRPNMVVAGESPNLFLSSHKWDSHGKTD